MDSDQPLIHACLAGDRRAWETLIRRYERLLYSIPIRCGLSEDDAADVFQVVCLRLLENLGKLRDERHLTGWLVTTAKHESWRLHRRRKRQQNETSLDPNDPGDLESVPGSDPAPHEEIIRLENEQLVRRAMSELAERCRLLLSLLYHTDPPPSYVEIARRLDVSPGAIGPTRARCLQQMKKVLDRLGF